MSQAHLISPRDRSIRALAAVAIAAAALLVAVAGKTPLLGERDAHALIRGGVARAGGIRAVSRTTVRPGVGVTRTVAYGGVAGARVLTPTAIVGRPGANLGLAARSIVVGRIYYGASTGLAYRYGNPLYALPGGCTAFFWEGTSAYRCGAATYAYDVVGGQYVYYPILY